MNESNKHINRTTARKTHHKFYGPFRSDLGLTGGMSLHRYFPHLRQTIPTIIDLYKNTNKETIFFSSS